MDPQKSLESIAQIFELIRFFLVTNSPLLPRHTGSGLIGKSRAYLRSRLIFDFGEVGLES